MTGSTERSALGRRRICSAKAGMNGVGA